MNCIERAKKYFNEGQFDYALLDCEYALKICKESFANKISEFRDEIIERKTATYTYNGAEKFLSLAYSALIKEDYDLAIKTSTKAIKLYRKVPILHLCDELRGPHWPRYIGKIQDSYIVRAKAYFEKGDYDFVLADCMSASKLNPKDKKEFSHYDSRILQAKTYLIKEDYDTALNVCAEMKWSNPDFYTIGAEAYLRKREYLLAIESCNKAIESIEKEEFSMEETCKAQNYFICAQAYFLLGNAGVAAENCDVALKELAEREWELLWAGIGNHYAENSRSKQHNNLCGGSSSKKIKELREKISKYSESIFL